MSSIITLDNFTLIHILDYDFNSDVSWVILALFCQLEFFKINVFKDFFQEHYQIINI